MQGQSLPATASWSSLDSAAGHQNFVPPKRAFESSYYLSWTMFCFPLCPNHRRRSRYHVLRKSTTEAPFRQFGKRQGCSNAEELLQLAAVSLIQTWLYFGLLWHFFDDHLNIADFVSTNSSDVRCITSTALRQYGARWIRSLRALDPEGGRLVFEYALDGGNFATELNDMLDDCFQNEICVSNVSSCLS